MPNTLLTPSIIAKEAILVLQNNMVFSGLVHRDFSNEFAKVGDTITVRKPATFTANEWNGSTIDIQDANETGVPVKMDKIIDVSFAAGSKELALSIQDFSTQFIQPAMRAHAQKLDSMIAGLWVDVPYFAQVGATPSMQDWANTDMIMNQNKVPTDSRNMVIDPMTKSKYIALPEILHASKSGSTDALRKASLGDDLMGFAAYMDQNIVNKAPGTATAGTATGTLGASTVDLASVTPAAGTILKGDVVTIDGNQYVCTEDATAVTGAISALKIYPSLLTAPSGATVTFSAKTRHNLAFHRNAFCLASRPLEKPMGAAFSDTISFNGISCRIVAGYDMSKKQDTISIDFLCGVKTLTPELACRFEG
ncbi:MAG: coat protein - protein 5 [Clostridiaceae bacterium]|nr:coat protein - protein 5 [Clostridiaceae bacterium]